jgi:hypothetical protein
MSRLDTRLGLLASFDNEQTLLAAVRWLHEAGCGPIETYTPHEVRLPGAEHHSRLPLLVALAGFAGFVAGFAMQTYAQLIDYVEDIGGRPDFSWPSYVPIAFEIGVLCAVCTGFFGFLAANRLPALYDPIDEADGFSAASSTAYLLALRSRDEADRERLRALLHDATRLADLPESI